MDAQVARALTREQQKPPTRSEQTVRLTSVGAIEHLAPRTDVHDDESGDFTLFYERHYPRLVGSLVLYTGDRELALDLAQEAMARAHRDWRKVSRFATPPAWLHRVAFNLASSAFRRKRVERRASGRVDARWETTHHDADIGDAVAVRRAVAGLPARQKTALVLRYYSDMDVAGTAKAMGCAAGTVRALTSQALASLRRSDLCVEHAR